MDELAGVIAELAGHLPLLDAQRAGGELFGAPRLSVFDLFKPNEIALSRIIGDLLDPKGTHGQGPLFLNTLLARLELPTIGVWDPAGVKVAREVPTLFGRQIDITVEGRTFIVGIENKPWARQLEKQITDYLTELRRRANGREVRFVFISDQKPDVSDGECVICIPYYATNSLSLFAILDSTIPSIKAIRTRSFIEEFQNYISLQFGEGDLNGKDVIVYSQTVSELFRRGTGEKRRAIAAMSLARENLHRTILDEIGAFLLGHVRDSVDVNIEVHTFYSDQQARPADLREALQVRWGFWGLRHPQWPHNCAVGISSDVSTPYKGLYFGIYAPDPNGEEVRQWPGYECGQRPDPQLILARVPTGHSSEWWPWWKETETRDWGPDFAFKLVLDGPTGAVESNSELQHLADRFVELVQAVNALTGA